MTRERLLYGEAREGVSVANGINPDVGISGFYRHRLRSDGMPVAIRIWFGPPREPWTGEELDRAPCWNAQMNSKWVDFGSVWPDCAGNPINEDEATYIERLQRWGADNGHDAIANPRKKLDPLSTPLLF